jgi:succinate dehydrogenase flavin-adding protein (antitoxin of CptAB toxin-antitoxin module)
MSIENNNLKKIIKYRLSYSGTKETDIIYQRLILNKLEILDNKELLLLSELFNEISDIEIFEILTNKKIKPMKYEKIFNKLINNE